MTINGGELVARALVRAGAKHIFGLHGGHVDPIFQACHDAGIRIIDTRHEQAAGHMADAWGRLTGEPGVAVVTAGPGVTDIVTAVANAHLDAVPMIVIGGRYPLTDDEMMPLQELHGVPVMQSITKWSRVVRDTERIGEYVDAAFHQATSGRPGPVFLEIPADTLAASVDEARVPPVFAMAPPARPRPSPEAVERILAALATAERPLIMAGRGVWLGGAASELREFAELTDTPVIANGMSRGCVPEDSRLGLGGFLGAGRALALGAQPDLVLMLGARFGLFTGGRQSIVPANAQVIQVDIVAGGTGPWRKGRLRGRRRLPRGAPRTHRLGLQPHLAPARRLGAGGQERSGDGEDDGRQHREGRGRRDSSLPRGDRSSRSHPRGRRPGGRRRRHIRLGGAGVGGSPSGPLPGPRVPRLSWHRPAVRPRREAGAPGRAGRAPHRRWFRRPQLHRVRYRRPPQPAHHRRRQQRPGVGHVQARADGPPRQ